MEDNVLSDIPSVGKKVLISNKQTKKMIHLNFLKKYKWSAPFIQDFQNKPL